MFECKFYVLLYKNPVHQDKSERNNEKDVREVEDKLWDMILSTEPLHIPVSNTNLHSTSFNFLIRLQTFQISTIESLV